jgi:type I restriction enzyme S subunit
MGNISTPKIRFPDFKGEWINNSLGEIAKFSKGKGISKEDISETGETECIRYGELYTTYNETIDTVFSKTNIDTSHLVLSEANDVIIPASGETEVDIAKASCILKSGIALGGDLNIIKTLNNGVFLSYYLNSKKKIDIAKLAQGISVVHLYAGQLSKLQLKIPSLFEQQKIASFFTAIDQKISQLKRKKTLLEQYKKGVMQKIFSQGIRFKDDNGQEYPKWKKMTGDALFETVSNKNHNSDLPILAITQEHGAIPRDMIDYYITVSEQSVESYKVVEKGDFIISLRSFQGGIEYSEYTGICSPAYIILRATQRIDHRYFKYYFKTDKYITDLNRKLEGIRDGKMISYKYFSEIEINVPSLPEQTKISNFLSAIDDKITHTQNQIEKAEVWKKGLMQQMFV